MRLLCKVCGKIIVEDTANIQDVKELMCPYCGRVFFNPFYDEDYIK